MATVPMRDDVHQKFRTACFKKGLHQKDVITELALKWLKQNGEIRG